MSRGSSQTSSSNASNYHYAKPRNSSSSNQTVISNTASYNYPATTNVSSANQQIHKESAAPKTVFANEVRANYVPQKEPQELSPHELHEKEANTLLYFAKKELMRKSKAGDTTIRFSGFRKIKAVETSFGFGVYSGGWYDDEYTGVRGKSEFELMQIYAIVKKLCKQEGIGVERNTDKTGILFWIEVS